MAAEDYLFPVEFDSLAEGVGGDRARRGIHGVHEKQRLRHHRNVRNFRKANTVANRLIMGRAARALFGPSAEVVLHAPLASFGHWGVKEGFDAWTDDAFVREFARDNEECRGLNEKPGNRISLAGKYTPVPKAAERSVPCS